MSNVTEARLWEMIREAEGTEMEDLLRDALAYRGMIGLWSKVKGILQLGQGVADCAVLDSIRACQRKAYPKVAKQANPAARAGEVVNGKEAGNA